MEQLATVFFALTDPTRRALIEQLAHGEATVTELARPLPISQPAVSQHLKILEDAGLVSRRIDGNRRPCQLRQDGLRLAEAWLVQQRTLWDQRLDRMESHIAELQGRQTPPQEQPQRQPQEERHD